jgi:pyruvate, orthophosphate dikinase
MADLDQNESQESLRESVSDASRRLESLFGDACEFSFTVEHGEFFVTDVHSGKRGLGVANVRMALDFFAKGYISLTEALSRLDPRDVHAFTVPVLTNVEELTRLGSGVPVYGGVVTGRIATCQATADAMIDRKEPYVYVVSDGFDIFGHLSGMWGAAGVIALSGGWTSETSIVCRGWEKPAVSGFSNCRMDGSGRLRRYATEQTLEEGDWITFDGTQGSVWQGRGQLEATPWRESPELSILFRIQEYAILQDLVQPCFAGGNIDSHGTTQTM